MKDEELKEIYGGINLSAELGKSLSSSFFKSKCSIN